MSYPIFYLSACFQLFSLPKIYSKVLHNIKVRKSDFVAIDISFSCGIWFLFSLFIKMHFWHLHFLQNILYFIMNFAQIFFLFIMQWRLPSPPKMLNLFNSTSDEKFTILLLLSFSMTFSEFDISLLVHYNLKMYFFFLYCTLILFSSVPLYLYG